MWPARVARCAAVVLLAIAAVRCGTSSTSPSPPPTVRPSVAITSIEVSAAPGTPGFRYRAVVHLRESSGVAATITGVDVTYARAGATLAVAHFDKPISDGTNVCPASGAVATRALDTVDADPSHPNATTIRATVTFTDGTAFTGSTTAASDVPDVAPPPPPQTYSISGAITDSSTHAGIPGARVEAINGANAGKAATTDANGTYVLAELVAETFRMRASANGYDPGEQNVTVPANAHADFELRTTAAPCAYAVTSNVPANVSYEGGQFTATVTRTSGSCGWQATTNVNWISFPNGATGSGSATLVFAVSPSSFDGRSGTITVAWTGGSAPVTVTQGPHPDWECFVSISKGPQDFDNVPSGGGTLTVFASITAVPSGWTCTGTVTSTVPWISGGGTVSGLATLTFTVAANPSPGTSRSGSIVGQVDVKTASVSVTQR